MPKPLLPRGRPARPRTQAAPARPAPEPVATAAREPEPRRPGAFARLAARLRGDGVLGPALLLFGGATGGQVLSLLAAPILSRLYAPAEFGALGAFLAVALILSPLATLRYELALPLARSAREASALLRLIGLVLLVTTPLFALAGLALAPWLVGDAQLDALAEIAPLAALAIASIGAYQAAAYEATRVSAFRPLSLSKLVQGALGPGAQIGFGLASFGVVGLALGFLIGQIASTLALGRALAAGVAERPSRAEIAQQAKRYVRFPLYASAAAILNNAGMSQIAILFVAALWDPVIAGFLFLAERIVARPLLMISSSILQAFMGDAARRLEADPGSLRARFRQIVLLQGGLSTVWCAAAYVLTPVLLAPVFGPEWDAGAPYIQALVPAFIALYTLHPVYDTLQLLERPKVALAWEAIRLLAVSAAFLSAYGAGLDALAALERYALAQVVACVVLLVVIDLALRRLRRRGPMIADAS